VKDILRTFDEFRIDFSIEKNIIFAIFYFLTLIFNIVTFFIDVFL